MRSVVSRIYLLLILLGFPSLAFSQEFPPATLTVTKSNLKSIHKLSSPWKTPLYCFLGEKESLVLEPGRKKIRAGAKIRLLNSKALKEKAAAKRQSTPPADELRAVRAAEKECSRMRRDRARATPTPSASPTSTPRQSRTPTPNITATATASQTPTQTPAVTATPTSTPTFTPTPNVGTITLSSSRTSGMAPLAVFFDVVGSISSPNLTWQQIEQGEFIWDFGDGTPLERGYMAAHVFQNPGTYTVSLSHLVGGVPVASGSRAITVQSFTGNRLTLNNGQIYDTSVLSGLGSGPVLVTAADPNGVLPTICTKLGNGQCDLSGGDRGVSSGTDWRFVGINLEHIAFYPGANTFFYKSRQRPPPAPPGGGQWPGIGLNADDTFIINSVIEGDSGTSDRYGVIGGAGRQRFAVVNSQFNDITYTVGRLYASKVLYAGNTLVKKQASANPAFRLVDGKYYYFKENYIQTTEGCAICSHRGADQPTGSYPGTEKFLIEKNFLSAWAPGASGFGSDQLVRDLVVRNNLISGVSPAVRVVSPKNSEFFPSPGVNTDNIRIYGNSMLASGAYFDALRVDGTGVAIKNNLFSYTGTPADTSPGGDSPRGITAAGDITNNIVYMPTYTSRCLNAAGQTGAGACTDPRFVSTDPNNANFLKIQPNSPAVDTGTPLLGLFSDYAGELRPQGAGYDIGAFEY